MDAAAASGFLRARQNTLYSDRLLAMLSGAFGALAARLAAIALFGRGAGKTRRGSLPMQMGAILAGAAEFTTDSQFPKTSLKP